MPSGVHMTDNPAVILNGNWMGTQQRLAAGDFLAFRVTEGQNAVKAAGYRTIEGELDAGVAETGRYATTVQPLPVPEAEAPNASMTASPTSASAHPPCSCWSTKYYKSSYRYA